MFDWKRGKRRKRRRRRKRRKGGKRKIFMNIIE